MYSLATTNSKKNFKVGDIYYIYYGSTASQYLIKEEAKETYYTDGLKTGDILKLNEGHTWWTYTKHTNEK